MSTPSSCLRRLFGQEDSGSTLLGQVRAYQSIRRHSKSITVCFAQLKTRQLLRKTCRVKYEGRTWNVRLVVEALTAVVLQMQFVCDVSDDAVSFLMCGGVWCLRV